MFRMRCLAVAFEPNNDLEIPTLVDKWLYCRFHFYGMSLASRLGSYHPSNQAWTPEVNLLRRSRLPRLMITHEDYE